VTAEDVENQARSIAMLPPGAHALDREQALRLLAELASALHKIRNADRRN
jgi:hypothetical protein